MQHHVAPTRLFDLTKSPFYCCLFAFEFCLTKKDNYIAIWCINIDYLKRRSLEVLSQEFGSSSLLFPFLAIAIDNLTINP
jgi:hypothetical protein